MQTYVANLSGYTIDIPCNLGIENMRATTAAHEEGCKLAHLAIKLKFWAVYMQLLPKNHICFLKLTILPRTV
ncbi:hypothetical protein SAMN06272759_1145 [Novosphingobium sp. B1]|nr:hypothetical protein SAMN06272759_1145 [Novosphingobium sp. B1]